MDPLFKEYPWYTPYQFAGNTPIQAIDIEGAEPLYVNYFNGIRTGKTPEITKRSQWYVYKRTNYRLNGVHATHVTDTKTFNIAAQFNSTNLNVQAYSTFGLKEEYYKWAQSQMSEKKINTQWFAMDAKIVGPYEVGLTEIDPGILSEDTRTFLNTIGSLVLKENMQVYNQLSSKGSFNGKTEGMALDRELLYNEQSKIQDFMYSFDIKNLNKYLTEYNRGFKVFQFLKSKSHYLNVASSVIGGDIDFGSIKHRMVIGQVLMYQMHGQKIDDKAKQTIMNNATEDTGRYYNERYGNDD